MPSTSRASDPSKAFTVKITKQHEAVTTKLNTEEQSKTDTDFQSASMLHDPKLTPGLTSDEINKILKRQPSICLISLKQKPPETSTAVTKISDHHKEKMHNQTPEHESKLPARAVKRQPLDEAKPAEDSAKCYKFKIAQHKLKWKYRCKYYFKYAVKECNRKFKSVCEWNTHHKTKHNDVIYTCSVCSKVLHTPSSIKDHKYTHNCKPHICSRCNQGFLSPSHLTQHKHTHHRQCLYMCFAVDCSNSYK